MWNEVYTNKYEPFICPIGLQPVIRDVSFGILISPNFPNNYPNKATCGWTINVPKGSKVTLWFWSLDVEVQIIIIIFLLPKRHVLRYIIHFIGTKRLFTL